MVSSFVVFVVLNLSGSLSWQGLPYPGGGAPLIKSQLEEQKEEGQESAQW